MKIIVVGNVRCVKFQRAKCLAEFARKTSPDDDFEIFGVFESDFDEICARVQSYLPLRDEKVLIFAEEKNEDNQIVQYGGEKFEEWVEQRYAVFREDWLPSDPENNFVARADREFAELMKSERSYWRIGFWSENEAYSGEVVFELADNICPKSCKFLCEKISSTFLTRAVADGWIQLGNDNSDEIAAESFSLRHEIGGIVGLCCSGAKRDMFGKEIYVTVRPLEHLDENGIAVGRVVEGLNLIRKISEIKTVSCSNQMPTIEVKVDKVEEIYGVSKDTNQGKIDVESIVRSILRGVVERVVSIG